MGALGLGLAAAIGLGLGVLGGGGSILTVPVFVYVLGFGAKEAIATSLAVVGAVSLFGAFGHWRAGNVRIGLALRFGSVAMVGTYLGARLAAFVSDAVQLSLFAVVMLAAAFFMLRGDAHGESASQPRDSAGGPSTRRGARIVVEGLAVGVLTGLVGVGGGFLIVPALVLMGEVPMKQAVGTSLLVIAMKSGAGFAGYLGQVEIAWGFVAAFSAVAVGGILVGTRLVRHLHPHALQRAFGVFLLLMGGFILYQNRDVLTPATPAGHTAAALPIPTAPAVDHSTGAKL